jgi:pimeloyl-ACP methyl ester carboxylesterase
VEKINIGSAQISYEVYGQGDITILIETALGSCSAEWWHIASALSKKYQVIVYDRAGYGNSTNSKLPRSPVNIVSELNELIAKIGVGNSIILAGHSQGGYYATQFALKYPEKVKGLVLLDPATPFDYEFKENLSEAEYKKSSVDKTFIYKFSRFITGLGIGFLFKPMMLKSPPFYYYKFEKAAADYILNAMIRSKTYKTAIEEYKYTHNNEYTKQLSEAINKQGLNSIPVILITHSSRIYVSELQQFASLDIPVAEKIENIWQSLMKRYLMISSRSEWRTASKSGHFIHLTDSEILMESIDKCASSINS